MNTRLFKSFFVFLFSRYISKMLIMRNCRIINIQEILYQKAGVGYKGEIGVFVSDQSYPIALAHGVPVYVNAFSYMLVLCGEAELLVDEFVHVLKKDMLCLISPMHLTCFKKVSSSFQCLFLCIHKNFIDRMSTLQVRQRIATGLNLYRAPVLQVCSDDVRLLHSCIQDIHMQIERREHTYHLELIQNALMRFYLELDQILERKILPVPVVDGQPRQVQVLRDFFSLLMDHYKIHHQVGFYADSMHISVQYLTAIIRKQTGKTVNTFIFELLYSEARNLLSSSDWSVQQISSELHFADQASFSKFFKRYSGLSPCQYRKGFTKR